MAKRTPGRSIKAPLVEADPKASFARLQRRLFEVDAMNDLKDPDDARLDIAERTIVSDIRDIFGPDSLEFQTCQSYKIWSGDRNFEMTWDERLRCRIDGVASARALLLSLAARVEERLESAPANLAPRASSKSELIGQWRVVKSLRRDGQGEIFLVERAGLAEAAIGVLKRIPRDVAADPKRLARFRHEIEIVQKLQHPFIAEVLDTNLDGEMWFVTRYAPLGSLADNVTWFKGDDWRSLRLVRDIATALEVAHNNKIVHRDIKPGNVLLYDPNHVALTDFGIAHHPDQTAVTGTHEKVGPRWFLPPEAEYGRTEPGCGHDIYMLGKILYHVLTGGQYFLREKFTEGEANIETMFGRPEFVVINELLGHMIVEDPASRFQTMGSVIAAVDIALGRLYGGRHWARKREPQLVFVFGKNAGDQHSGDHPGVHLVPVWLPNANRLIVDIRFIIANNERYALEFWNEKEKVIDSGILKQGRNEVNVSHDVTEQWLYLRVRADDGSGTGQILNLVVHALGNSD
jgi:hypothetical protein